MSDTTTETKPNVLILGGLGFVGRNLVQYLVNNDLVNAIRVLDKSMLCTVYAHDEHKAAFEHEKVTVKQADLSREAHVEKGFEDFKVDYVINLCGETRYGLPEGEYKQKNVATASMTGKISQKHNIKKYIELSHAQIYAPSSTPSNEDGKLSPWTLQAKYRLEAEEELKKIDNLPLVILRPVSIYGKGDLSGLMPRISVAAVYQYTKKKQENLWGKDLCLNAVHVDDVVRAIWVGCTELPAGSVYNLSDSSNLTQGKLNDILCKIFTMKVGYFGSIISNLAKMNLSSTADEANGMHVPAWFNLCKEHKILNTPITPFLDKELLYNNHLSIDGSAISKKSSFKYKHEQVTVELLKEEIQFVIDQGIFPPVLTK